VYISIYDSGFRLLQKSNKRVYLRVPASIHTLLLFILCPYATVLSLTRCLQRSKIVHHIADGVLLQCPNCKCIFNHDPPDNITCPGGPTISSYRAMAIASLSPSSPRIANLASSLAYRRAGRSLDIGSCFRVKRWDLELEGNVSDVVARDPICSCS